MNHFVIAREDVCGKLVHHVVPVWDSIEEDEAWLPLAYEVAQFQMSRLTGRKNKDSKIATIQMVDVKREGVPGRITE